MTVDAFDAIKNGILNIDPVYFIENNLTIDGKPFKLTGNGYKPFVDIYRYVGIKALEKNSKPVVIVKGRQVGATVMAAALECFFMASGNFGTNGNPPIRVMHAFPTLELVAAYAKTKLNPMIDTAKIPPGAKPGAKVKNVIREKLDATVAANDSLSFKQFQGGNHLFIESLGLDGNRTMGKSSDILFVDESATASWNAVAKTEKILTSAQYGRVGDGVKLFFGTPLQAGSDFYKIWNRSNQQYFYLGCEKCGELFPLYTPASKEWENIWIRDFIVKCSHCEHEQDKIEAAERGKWVALNDNPNCDFIGFHISQLYIPYFNKEKIIREKPENHPTNTERVYQNEVLGEFYSGSSAPLTPDLIDTMCADRERKFARQIIPNDNKRVYLGLDWGDKVDADLASVGEEKRSGGQSYSCAVVMTADGPNLLSIQFAKRLKSNDPETKRSTVEELFKRYSVNLAIGDVGHAGDLTYILQEMFGDKFLASRAVGQVRGHVNFDDGIFPKEIKFERDYWIEEFIDFIKKGNLKFPYGNYEQLAWLIQHCCSMDLKVSIDRYGQAKGRYVKGSTPNDGFMAALNAYIAFRYDQSNGFKIKNPKDKIVDFTEKRPFAVLAYAPKKY